MIRSLCCWVAIRRLEATTITAIRQWLYPTADLYDFQPLFNGLRLAGLSD